MQINCPSVDDINYRKFTFPAGELHIILSEKTLSNTHKNASINFLFKKSEDIVELLLLVDTLKRNNFNIRTLYFPYLPFGQADRVNEDGECFSLKWFCSLVNDWIRPEKVVLYDPHSDVAVALLNKVNVIHQHELLGPIIYNIFPKGNFVLVCPDAGAEKKF